MVMVSLTGAKLLLQSLSSILMVAVLLTVVWGELVSEYQAVGTPGDTPILEQLWGDEPEEDELLLTVVVLGVKLKEVVLGVGVGVGAGVYTGVGMMGGI